MGAVSGVVVLLLCLVAIFADLLAPFHYMVVVGIVQTSPSQVGTARDRASDWIWTGLAWTAGSRAPTVQWFTPSNAVG